MAPSRRHAAAAADLAGFPAVGAWAGLSVVWSIEPERTLKEWRNEMLYTGLALWMCFVGAQARNAARILSRGGAAAAAVMASGCATSRRLVQYSRACMAARQPFQRADRDDALRGNGRVVRTARRWTRIQLPVWSRAALLVSAYARSIARCGSAWRCSSRCLACSDCADGTACGRPRAKAPDRWSRVLGGCDRDHPPSRLSGGRSAAKSSEKDSRLALWPEVGGTHRERPLTGYGFGRGVLRARCRRSLAGSTNISGTRTTSFSSAASSGTPGLLLLLVLLAAILREAGGLAREADDFHAACGVALLAVVAGMLVAT